MTVSIQVSLVCNILSELDAARNLDELVLFITRGAVNFVTTATYMRPIVKCALIREDFQSAAIFEERPNSQRHLSTSVMAGVRLAAHANLSGSNIGVSGAHGQHVSCMSQSGTDILGSSLQQQHLQALTGQQGVQNSGSDQAHVQIRLPGGGVAVVPVPARNAGEGGGSELRPSEPGVGVPLGRVSGIPSGMLTAMSNAQPSFSGQKVG